MKYLIMFILSIPVSAQQENTVADLFWLTGRWEMVKGERRTEEVWLAPAGNKMFSVSRTVKNGKAAEHEFVTVEQDSIGDIYFRAQPSGQEGGSFRLVSLEKRSVVFENRQHDFPQRIVYHLISDDSLVARIEGTVKGKTVSIDFPYRKIKN